MKICIAEMPSYTYAVKAAKLLKTRGYSCKITRRKNNCGFSLELYERHDEAIKILKDNSIPFDDISCGGG